jgi:hypothetical protein
MFAQLRASAVPGKAGLDLPRYVMCMFLRNENNKLFDSGPLGAQRTGSPLAVVVGSARSRSTPRGS